MVRLVPLESEKSVMDFLDQWKSVCPDGSDDSGINCLALIVHDRWVMQRGCWLEKCLVLQEEYVAVVYE
jgi:hypothetical protein